MKQQKKQAKKEQIEREEAIKEKLKETHKIMSLLDQFADENIRDDFLNERSGASVSNYQPKFCAQFRPPFWLIEFSSINLNKIQTQTNPVFFNNNRIVFFQLNFLT